LPEGVSENLLAQIRERDVTPVTVNVSEFLKKGGGSVKCMIGDLGLLAVSKTMQTSVDSVESQDGEPKRQ
jgi:hypothetical protein